MADIVCLGEALIDFVALEPCSDVGDASGFVRAAGGAPANVAVGAARLGCSCAFLGKVGDDPFGRFLGRTFAESGVDIRGMVFDHDLRTGLAFVSLAENGERDFCFFRNPSADTTYTADELDIAAIDSCRIFHFGSITLIDSSPKLATISAVNRAREAGKLISYDPNLRPPLWPSLSEAQAAILETANLVDMVKVSEEELSFLVSKTAELPQSTPSESETAANAAQFMQKFPQISLLAVTRGARGCIWWTAKGLRGSHPGFTVLPVDTTGAGDGFVAGLLSGILALGVKDKSERNDRRALLSGIDESSINALFARANAVGAITTTRKGAISALPTTAELKQFIAGCQL